MCTGTQTQTVDGQQHQLWCGKITGAATDGLWTKRLIEKLLRIGCATDLHSRSYKDLFRIIKASMRVNSLGKPSVLL